MLLSQHRGGNQQRDLLAIHHRFKRCPQGYFGLSITHITAQQPVHRPGGLHITFYIAQWPAVDPRFRYKGSWPPVPFARECLPETHSPQQPYASRKDPANLQAISSTASRTPLLGS